MLERVQIDDSRWSRPLAPAELEQALQGRRVEKLRRRGKYLVWELSDEMFLIAHLRMTGTFLWQPAQIPPHARVTIGLDDGSMLVYNDPRRFGTGELARGPHELEAFFAARLGVEPLSAEFTPVYLRARARLSRAPIKAFLLDQTKIAGVGNIYADEALFRARIHPLRPAQRLTPSQSVALRDSVVAVLEAGIAARGSSIDDYRDPDGVAGSFQDRFHVYSREGLPCSNCGRPIRKLRVAGRGTYVCERCQPRPRAVRRLASPPAGRPDRHARAH